MKKLFATAGLLFMANIIKAQSFEQLNKLFASDRAAGNQFGSAVSVSGNIAVVGAGDISGGQIQNSCSCAYVFEKTNTGWAQVQKLEVTGSSPKDDFAHAVSISANYILIGAPENDFDAGNANNLAEAGAAYVFERSQNGKWLLAQKIVAPDRSAADLFGTAVSVSGNYLVVGAPGDADYNTQPKMPGAGSAYFFTRGSDGKWKFLNKVAQESGDRSEYTGFGTSVGISGNDAVIGAPFEKKDSSGMKPLEAAGAVYLFERSTSGEMQLVHKLVNFDRLAGDQFGYAVSMSGDKMVVGAPFEDEDESLANTLVSSGSAYVFHKLSDGRWWWYGKLVAPGRAAGDNFGLSVGISGDMVVAGAATADEYSGDIKLNSSGAAYVFKLSLDSLSSGWRVMQKLVATDRDENDWFGYHVGIDNGKVIVGAPFQDRNETRLMANDAGAAYFFGDKNCEATTAYTTATACKNYTSPSKKYTWSASGSYTDIILNKAGCDSVITINLTITGKADTSVVISGNTLTARASNAKYQWIDCANNQPINITTQSLTATVSGKYKVSVEQEGCTGVSSCHEVRILPSGVKQPPELTANTTTRSVLKKFVEMNKLVAADRNGYENFGYSVAVSNDYAVVGANVDDEDANGQNPLNDAGSAYVFKKGKDGKWIQQQKLVAVDRAAGDNFGWSVAVSLKHIVVGAVYQDKGLQGSNHGPSSGAAYIFELGENGVWTEKQKIIATPVESQILFGSSVAIDGNTIAVGCPSYAKDATGSPGSNINSAGAVFVFEKTGGAWVQSALLTPKNRGISNLGDELGNSVSVCGNLIIAGAWGADFDNEGGARMEAAGSAYIFERSGGTWVEVQKIVPRDRAAYDEFGNSVSISGDNAIIGARRKTETTDPNSRAYTGNAYIFSRKAPPQKVRPDGGVVVAPDPDGKWYEVLKINPGDRKPDDYLGWSVGISGNYAVMSAMKQDTDSLEKNPVADGGAIYVFYQDQKGNWAQSGKLTAKDRSQLDNLGCAVAISGCNIIGGTIFDQEDAKNTNALTSAGSAYIFAADDCRNIPPCFHQTITPDTKTPLDKTKETKNVIPKN